MNENAKDLSGATAEERRRALQLAAPMPHPDEVREAELDQAKRAAFERSAPPVGSLIDGALALMRARATREATPVPTPWPELSEALGGGFWPGLHVLTGETGAGKSQWALQIALSAAKANVPTLYVNLELGREDIVARLLALEMAEADPHAPRWSQLFLGKDSAAIETAARAPALALHGLPLRVEVGSPFGWASDQLPDRVAALRSMYPEEGAPGSRPLLVILDYLQAIAPPMDPTANPPRPARMELRERIGMAAGHARTAARDYGAAVLLLSSVSRENTQRLREAVTKSERTPATASGLVGLGKESGEIEYSADSVIALGRGETDATGETPIHLALAKMRAGSPRWVDFTFNGSWFEPAGAVRTLAVGRRR